MGYILNLRLQNLLRLKRSW